MAPFDRLVCYFDSREKWLSRAETLPLTPCAIEELSYQIPAEDHILSTFEAVASVLVSRSVACTLIEANDNASLAKELSNDDGKSILWNMTDGFYPVTASYFPAFAAMRGRRYFGNSSALQLMVQNKYLQYITCRQLNIRTPTTHLFDGGVRVSDEQPLDARGPFFVKPFDLANSIGIFSDAVCDSLDAAIEVAARIKEHYRTKSLVQQYVAGRTIRVNYVAAERTTPIHQGLGMHLMAGPSEYEGEFTSFERHLEIFKSADAEYEAKAVATNIQQAAAHSGVVAQIQSDVEKLVRYLSLRDFFSLDYKLTNEGACYFIEVNTMPFTRNAGLRGYCRERFGLTVGKALAEAIVGSDCSREW